ncbi:MAG: hypothetical protein AAB413_04120 [Patescibacteria group bacterium]
MTTSNFFSASVGWEGDPMHCQSKPGNRALKAALTAKVVQVVLEDFVLTGTLVALKRHVGRGPQLTR